MNYITMITKNNTNYSTNKQVTYIQIKMNNQVNRRYYTQTLCWSASMIMIFCGLHILYVVSSMGISLGVCIFGVSIAISLKYDLTHHEIFFTLYGLIVVFISRVIATVLWFLVDDKFVAIACIAGNGAATLPIAIFLGQAIFKNGYVTFYPNYAFSAFVLFALFAFIYSDTANVFYSFFPSNLTNVSTFHTQINTVQLVQLSES
ncbi:hypothetical protein EWB00_010380 [Schistosoma japonicum]|uniref:Uncharacterized protein n=1 Tax=Schistosoma japonicum TaxID=6182 RepID=A0A4Z2CKV8_SCHJA|nr:hypothetical protein EWB00_010380 [Schistosoma japonicum]